MFTGRLNRIVRNLYTKGVNLEFVEFKGGTGRISIVVKHIQSVNEETKGDRKGKANIVVARLGEEVDDYFCVEETYEEALKKLRKVDL